MGKLTYDPGNLDESKGGGKPAIPGRYNFSVTEALEVVFTNSEGLKIEMLVAVDDRDIRVFENLVYLEQCQWKLKQFLECIGASYDDPPDIENLYNAQGVADFKLGKPQGDEGRRYLEVQEFLQPGTNASGPTTKGRGAGSAAPLPSRNRAGRATAGGPSTGGGGRKSKQTDESFEELSEDEVPF